MAEGMRVTAIVARVLKVFLDDLDVGWYGLELTRATGLPSGTLYPVLARLERAEWLVSRKEAIDPRAVGRPARRYYTLNPIHVGHAQHEVATLAEQLRLAPSRSRAGRSLHPAPQGRTT